MRTLKNASVTLRPVSVCQTPTRFHGNLILGCFDSTYYPMRSARVVGCKVSFLQSSSHCDAPGRDIERRTALPRYGRIGMCSKVQLAIVACVAGFAGSAHAQQPPPVQFPNMSFFITSKAGPD